MDRIGLGLIIVQHQMVSYLQLLPLLGALFAGGVHSKTSSVGDAADGNSTVGNWDYVPGAYIIEYEQGHVS